MNEITVNNFELPKIEIKDYDKLLKAVEEDTEKYKNYIVTAVTLDADTKKRAELRNIAKSIDERRKDIERKISEPIKEFKSKCDTLKKLYEDSALLIDGQVKIFEGKEKEEKQQEIKKIFNESIDELKDILNFEKVFNPKWLNKTYKITDIEKEIKAVITKTSDELTIIENLNSEYEVELKNDYLNSLDLGQVLIKNSELMKKKELLQKASVERVQKQEQQKQEKIEEVLATEIEIEEIDPIKEYKLKLKAPLSKLKALRKFLDLNNIEFERID